VNFLEIKKRKRKENDDNGKGTQRRYQKQRYERNYCGLVFTVVVHRTH
jgi:hypothetical protein